ncbi:MAG: GerMN domain-containing protein [Phormidesmis sp. CAN_BIN36]|nr:GerMN domain-containing protein [Phormidesmis sp. CAN_BIN36]
MQDQPTNRRIPAGVIAGLSALAVTAGSATAFVAWQTATQPKPIERVPEISKVEPQPAPSASVAPLPITPTQPIQPPPPKVAPVVEKTAQIYWLKDSGELVAVPIKLKSLKSDDRSETVLNGAIETLLNGSPDQALTTTIPQGTQLRSLAVKPDGIHIDLSAAFKIGGGSASMMGRVGQVLYTATSTDPGAPVFLSVGGQPLETLGGEGLMLDQPMTRRSFAKEFTLTATP